MKRPTVKNPQAKIEVEAKMENLEEPEKTETVSKTEELQAISSQQPFLQIPLEDSVKARQVSPTGIKTSSGNSNQVEQPKISQNALENVKLRSTVRYKPAPPQPTSSNGLDEILNGRAIANRLSLFEQQKHELQLEKDKEKPASQFMNIRLKKTTTDATTDLNEHAEGIS